MDPRLVLASPFGFLIGLSLGALGGGGSILAVPILVLVAGLSPSEATSTSLVVVGAGSLIGALGHWRDGKVRVAPGVVFGLVGAGGSVLGTIANHRVDGDVLLLAFSGLMLVAAWRILVGCPGCVREDYRGDDGFRTRAALVRTRSRVVRVVAAGTTVGFMSGFFGVGGGFVIVPALTLVLQFPIGAAVGTSLLVIAINSGVALLARVGSQPIDWPTTIVFASAAIVGVGAGRRLARRIDARTMRTAFVALLVAVALLTGTRALVALL